MKILMRFPFVNALLQAIFFEALVRAVMSWIQIDSPDMEFGLGFGLDYAGRIISVGVLMNLLARPKLSECIHSAIRTKA